jgi:ring-1,2-phenylacetyl-CoA epoxidase subunit PaaD
LVDDVWRLLEGIPDPEIPVLSIRELGILRDVRWAQDGIVEVVVTPTYSGCPAIGQIEDDIRTALSGAGIQARVLTQLAPAWTTDWMDEDAHRKLKNYGISPPKSINFDRKVVQFIHKKVAPIDLNTRPKGQINENSVPCPLCESLNTTETSHFASTACKALYKCLDCLEPFDYFKPY